MRRRHFLSVVGTASVVGAAGCLSVPALGIEAFDIGMSANAFRPESFVVGVGEPVSWHNDGSRGHTVTAYHAGLPEGAEFFASGGFEDESAARAAWTREEGGIIHPGEDFEYTFSIPGAYEYFCVPHEAGGMIAEVVVDG